jgi:hypothetical protein
LHRRNKRFFLLAIGFIIAAIAIAGTSYALYKRSELNKMKANTNTLASAQVQEMSAIQNQAYSQKELAHLVQGAVATVADEYGNIEETQHDIQAIYVAEKRVALYEDIMTAALNKQVSPAIFNDIDIEATTNMVIEYAAKNHLVPIASFYSDILQMETSFIASPEGYTLYIHVPLMGPASGMFIYQHAKLPMPLGDGFHALIESRQEYLAINSLGSYFKAMTAADIANCRRMGDYYVCDRGNVVRQAPSSQSTTSVKDPEVCLWALFKEKYDIAASTCDISVNVAPNIVIQLTANKFAMYTAKPHQGTINCRNDSQSIPRTFQLDKLSTIELPAGCTAVTDTHVFAAADSAFTRPATEWAVGYKWALHAKSLTKGLDTNKLREISKKLGHFANATSIPLEHALQAVRKVQQDTNEAAGIYAYIPHGTGTAMFFSLLANLLAVISLWKINSTRNLLQNQNNSPTPTIYNLPNAPIVLGKTQMASQQSSAPPSYRY